MGIEYSDMLFYDDEHKNVHKASGCDNVGRNANDSAKRSAHGTGAPLLRIKKCTFQLACVPTHPAHLQVSKLGVCSVLVSTRTGVNVKALEEGLRQFAAQQAGS